MNKELFRSMQLQMRPGGEARAALAEKLASAKKKAVPVGRCAAIAACVAVIVAAVPVYRAVSDHLKWKAVADNFLKSVIIEPAQPHSYVLASELYGRPKNSSGMEITTDTGGRGDQDQDMTPGGAYIGDAPDQSEAVMAYQNLMARFEAEYGPDRCPEWYGGAYIDGHGGLIVNITAGCEPEDKELFFQIWDWAGSDRVGFGSSPASLNDLRALQDRIGDAIYDLGLDFGCGVNKETGQVELTLPVATDEALWKLAELDPAGAGVLVIVGGFATTDLVERPAPSVSHDIQPGGAGADPRTPVSNTPGTVVDADNAIAYEPQG